MGRREPSLRAATQQAASLGSWAQHNGDSEIWASMPLRTVHLRTREPPAPVNHGLSVAPWGMPPPLFIHVFSTPVGGKTLEPRS